MAEEVQPEQVVRDYFAWENGDESKRDAVSESLVMYNPGLPGGVCYSREPYAQYLREVRNGFPDVHFAVEEMAAREDVVFVEMSVTGTHQGEFDGLPPTGRAVEFGAMGKWRVSDGEVVEVHVYYDTATLPEQLGLTFPAVLGQLPSLALGKLRSAL